MTIIEDEGREFDEWIIGAGVELEDEDGGQQYVIHLAAPRFICKLGSDEEQHFGLTYACACGGEEFFDFIWLDEPPALPGPDGQEPAQEFFALMAHADKAVEEYALSLEAGGE